jgi:hypothetical protein
LDDEPQVVVVETLLHVPASIKALTVAAYCLREAKSNNFTLNFNFKEHLQLRYQQLLVSEKQQLQ